MITTAHLFRPLAAELLTLLRQLPADAWEQPTSAAEWTVRDVAAHLLDGDLRRLSAQRDGWVQAPSRPVASADDLVAHLNELNRTWVRAASRFSPQVLIELLELSSARIADTMEASDPTSPATFAVAWAGETRSAMWLDIAREYTERWHHQDQIREATNAPPLADNRWLRPVLETSLLALPHAFRNLDAADGTVVSLRIDGESGGEWTLSKQGAWTITAGNATSPVTTIRASDLDMCRLLMHRLTRAQAERLVSFEGRETLAAALLNARAVMV